MEICERPWEAVIVYQQPHVVANKVFSPKHLAEVARAFKAWKAETTDRLCVLMVPKQSGEGEWIRLMGNGIHFFDDVPWIL